MKRPKLKLLGNSGNAFAILAKARKVAKKNNLNWEEIKMEAMSGDYNQLLRTMMKHFDVE